MLVPEIDTEMQVFAGGSPGGSGHTDRLPGQNGLSGLNQPQGKMSVNTLDIPVIDPDKNAQDRISSGGGDPAVHHTEHWIITGSQVYAPVKIRFAGHRMDPPAEGGGHGQTG